MPLTLTRIAHSSTLLDFDGQPILTDPWYSEKPGYYHGEPYGIALADLPRLTGVVVSHDHYDHGFRKASASGGTLEVEACVSFS